MSKKQLTYISKRATDKEHGHTEVYLNDQYLGYYMNNTTQGDWTFVSAHLNVSYFNARTRQEIKDTLSKMVNGEEVTLNLHFGIQKTINK